MTSQESSLVADFEHRPAQLREVLELLAPNAGDTIVDATLGAGGHAGALLDAIGEQGRLFGIDRDPSALSLAANRFAEFGDRFVPLHGRHERMKELLESQGVEEVDAILLDLGVSSMQLNDPERGFSFLHDGPLDMRMDPGEGRTAAELIAEIDESELRRILWRFGEERSSRAIARAIVKAREDDPILRTGRLAEIVERAVPAAVRFRSKRHAATRTFQALRIAVNGELERLESTLIQAIDMLASGGRLAVIAFHSLEDRVVKRTLRDETPHCTCPLGLPVCTCGTPGRIRLLTSGPLRASDAEVTSNPRARSSLLRGAEKL